MIGLAGDDAGDRRGVRRIAAWPAKRSDRARRAATPRCSRNGSSPNCRPLVAPDEWPALLDRAPLDLRVNVARTSREAMVDAFDGAEPTPLSPWGLRLPRRQPGRRASRLHRGPGRGAGRGQPADRAGVRRAGRVSGSSISAPARAASRWRLPPPRAVKQRSSPATPTAPACRKLPDRARRAGAAIATRLLNAPRELEELADLDGTRRHRPGRCALLGQRDLAPQSRRALAADARAARPGGRAPAARCSISPRRWSNPAERWSMRSVRC